MTAWKFGVLVCAVLGAVGIALVFVVALLAAAVGVIDGVNKRQSLRRQRQEAEATIAAIMADLDAELIELPLSPDKGDDT